jgi:hypothetical protein
MSYIVVRAVPALADGPVSKKRARSKAGGAFVGDMMTTKSGACERLAAIALAHAHDGETRGDEHDFNFATVGQNAFNLGAHLLMDGFQNRYEAAIVVTGDSDLITPIRMVRQQLRKTVGVLNPQRLSGPDHRAPRASAGLLHVASFYQHGISWAQLEDAQFPNPLHDSHGAFHKPSTW